MPGNRLECISEHLEPLAAGALGGPQTPGLLSVRLTGRSLPSLPGTPSGDTVLEKSLNFMQSCLYGPWNATRWHSCPESVLGCDGKTLDGIA